MQSTFRVLHALDVLALQNEIQQYHLNYESIPDYTNKLEDTQAKAERPNNPITDAALVIIAMSAMLITKQFPQVNEDWEELDVSQRTWARWKSTYFAAAKKATIKKKAAGRKDQFGAAHSATPPLEEDTKRDNQTLGLAALDRYFENLTAAVTNEKSVLEELVKNSPPSPPATRR